MNFEAFFAGTGVFAMALAAFCVVMVNKQQSSSGLTITG